MSNPKQTIDVYDMPLRVIAGLSSLAKTPEEDNNTSTGIVVSEVGEPQLTTLPSWCDSFVSYQLRAPRQNKVPDFIFGRADVNNAFCAFLPRRFPAPAVGTRLTINPICTMPQYVMMQLYNNFNADFHYIIHVPAPLGTGIYLKVYAPEFDNTTVTRGIRFKPSGQPTVAVSVPWSNDLSLVPIEAGRPGQSGGSIIIETIEDNSSETVNSPLMITVWCCMSNLKMTGYRIPDTAGYNHPGMNFMPLTPTPPSSISGEEQADTEVSTEGGKDVAELIYDKSAIPVAPKPETQAAQPKLPEPRLASRKNDTGHLATKWYEFTKISLSSPTNMSWTVLTIDPYNSVTLSRDGESMVLPWRRNLWTTGSRHLGYVRTLVAQINIPRPPQISGVLEVKDSINNSSISLVEFGGKVEIPLIPKVFNGLRTQSTLSRSFLNPWMRTAESKVELAYRIIAFNRTSDIADLNVNVMLRPGESIFQLPTKPDNNVDTRHFDLVDLIMDHYNALRIEGEEQADVPNITDPATFITPMMAHTPEEYNVHYDVGDDEDLELDEFPVLVFKGDIPVDEVSSFHLDLPTIFDHAWDGDQNAISQKFQRFAHIIPKEAGGFGPVIGNYTITANLPTGVAGRIVHNCLPGDCVDQAASRVFGLKSLLGIAGSAVSAVGGPLVNGLVNTAAPLISKGAHAIGGKVVGNVADIALDLVTDAVKPKIPMKDKEEAEAVEPTKAQESNPSANSASIMGEIPTSRYIEFVKYVTGNFNKEPVMPTLLVEPQNFLTNAMTKLLMIPVEIFVHMRSTKTERNLFDRLVVPVISQLIKPSSVIPNHAFGYIMRDFLQNRRSFVNGTKQNRHFKQFLTVLSARNMPEMLTFDDVLSCPIDDTEDVTQMIGRVKRYLVKLSGETTKETLVNINSIMPLN